MSHIHFDGVSISADNQNSLFPPFSESISHEIVGLFGRNGSGKSSLLSAIAGDRTTTRGTITIDGQVGYMRQGAFAAGVSVAHALGVEAQLSMLERIEAGDPLPDDLDNADWSLPARLETTLAKLELPNLSLKREAAELSGGEQCRLRIAALLLTEPDILLLDEPTNDLDDAGRAIVAGLLRDWKGPALVASHDRALLEGMDRIIELSPAGALSVGGGWSTFKAERDEIRAQAIQALEDAEQNAKQARAVQQARSERQARRSKQGKLSSARRDASRLEINAQKSRAEKTSARTAAIGQEQVLQTKAAIEEASARVERIVPVRIKLPASGLQRGQRLLDASRVSCSFDQRTIFGPLDISITGPERIALTGANGSGKSTLLKVISGALPPTAGTVRTEPARTAVLDQHLSLLSPDEDALAAMQRLNPALNKHEAHAALAQYGFRADWCERVVASLSGGERVRLALACLFSGPTPPQLLLLDEPTNHLDVYAIEMLEQALCSYDGAIACVSHDADFRSALKLEKTVDLGIGIPLNTPTKD